MEVLNRDSLTRTLRNLEGARLAGRPPEDRGVREALDWVAGRLGRPDSYRGLFAPTAADLEEKQPALTGEFGGCGRECARHMLGEESVRALILWHRTEDWPAARTVELIRDKWRTRPLPNPGYFCCPGCAVSRWRTLLAGRPERWVAVLSNGLARLAKQRLDDRGGWYRYPLAYTLLALREMPFDEADTQRRRVRPAADAALAAIAGDDLAARFSREALEWAVA